MLVDEAHNFRNPGTRRYAALSSYLWDVDRKVVLLSATPQNLGPADIYHQLRLFLDDLDHGLPLEPQSLQEYFAAIQTWYQYDIDLANWQQEQLRWQASTQQRASQAERAAATRAQRSPAFPTPRSRRCSSPVFLRRRRKDIRELYGDDVEVGGKKVRFPEPVLDNLTYRLDKVYDQAAPLDDISGAWTSIVARATSPRVPDARRAPRARLPRSPPCPQPRRPPDALPAVQAPGIQRRGLSLHARRADPEQPQLPRCPRRRVSSRSARPRPPCWPAPISTSTSCWSASRPKRSAATRPACHGRGSSIRPATSTCALAPRPGRRPRGAGGARADVSRVTPGSDDKLLALRDFLARPDVAAGKVLIFSEAAATVDYLYQQLNPGGADPSIERLSGSNRDHLQAVVGRFAPTSGLLPGRMPAAPRSAS